jgi:sulfoxide reductase heme-binding subunit YedZ
VQHKPTRAATQPPQIWLFKKRASPEELATVSARALIAAVLRAPQRYYPWTWRLVFVLCLMPLATLVWEYFNGQLGVNPFERLSHYSGTWALNLLLVTLSVTPARRYAVKLCRAGNAMYGRRMSDWNWLFKLRRMLGLSSFFYAVLHAAVYLVLDLDLDLAVLAREFAEKPYIAAGVAAFVLLVPLAATSTDGMMRRLGRNWRRLHRLVYPIGIIAALHYIWFAKVGVLAPYVYAAVLAALLLDRVTASVGWRALGKPKDDGMEVPERAPQSVPARAV